MKTILCPNCGQVVADSPCPFCHHPVAIDGVVKESQKGNPAGDTSQSTKPAELRVDEKHRKRKTGCYAISMRS